MVRWRLSLLHSYGNVPAKTLESQQIWTTVHCRILMQEWALAREASHSSGESEGGHRHLKFILYIWWLEVPPSGQATKVFHSVHFFASHRCLCVRLKLVPTLKSSTLCDVCSQFQFTPAQYENQLSDTLTLLPSQRLFRCFCQNYITVRSCQHGRVLKTLLCWCIVGN